jgi:hypothetical protein
LETADEFERRSIEADRDHSVAMRFARETANLTEADRIYLARVSQKTNPLRQGKPTPRFANQVIVRPVAAVRGQLPSSSRSLVSNWPFSCDIDGNGYAASGQVGE